MSFSKSITPERKVAVLGRTGTGKSYLCNKFSGSSDFEEGSTIFSQTSVPQTETFQIHYRDLAYRLTLIDTPGFGDNRKLEKESFISNLQYNLFNFFKRVRTGFNLGILCVNANKPRIDNYELDDLVKLVRLIGYDVCSNIIIGLTMTNLIENESERAQRVESYKRELPKMLKQRGIDKKIDIIDAGDHVWENFKEKVYAKAINLDTYKSDLIEDLGAGKDCKDDREIKNYLQDNINEKIAQLKQAKQQEEQTFKDEQKLKALEKQIKELEAEAKKLQDSDTKMKVLKICVGGFLFWGLIYLGTKFLAK